jgi:hypothetical protein
MAIGASKLENYEIYAIKYMAQMGYKHTEITKDINENKPKEKQISRSHITNIINGKRWNEIKKSYIMKDDIPKEIKKLLLETLSKLNVGNTSSENSSLITEEKNNQINEVGENITVSLSNGKEINIKIQIC